MRLSKKSKQFLVFGTRDAAGAASGCDKAASLAIVLIQVLKLQER
jgi:hypothetical protein